jgi:hypothetical protein
MLIERSLKNGVLALVMHTAILQCFTRIHAATFIQRETSREMRREIKQYNNIVGYNAEAVSAPDLAQQRRHYWSIARRK